MEARASSITGQCRRQQHRWACMVDGRALYSLHFSSCRESLSCSALVAPAGVKFSHHPPFAPMFNFKPQPLPDCTCVPGRSEGSRVRRGLRSVVAILQLLWCSDRIVCS